jgi:tetratricopeptide (TPR) repeat protein
MGLFSRLFGGTKPVTIPPRSIILNILDKHASTWDNNSIIKDLDNLQPDNLSAEDKENWYFYRGVCEMKLGNRDKAFEIFEIGLKKCPHSQNILFSLGQEYANRSDKENAIRCFSQVKYSHQTSTFFYRIIQYLYLWGNYTDGIKMTQPILEAIFELGIIDDTFLHIRELPFFKHIYPVKIVFSYLSEGKVDRNEFQKFRSKFRDDDFDQFENLITALVDKNYQPIIESAKRIHESGRKNKIRSTFQELQIAFFENKTENNLEHGLRRIEAIKIDGNNYPWLNDAKTLGKAELYARLGHHQSEQETLDKYFENQILMFDPYISLDFGFVDYQEKIKAKCNDRKAQFSYKNRSVNP